MKRPMPTAAPTAVPAMAPVGKVEDDSEAREYLRVKSWEVIRLAEAPAGVGAVIGEEGVVTQGVSPAKAELYIDQPLLWYQHLIERI